MEYVSKLLKLFWPTSLVSNLERQEKMYHILNCKKLRGNAGRMVGCEHYLCIKRRPINCLFGKSFLICKKNEDTNYASPIAQKFSCG